MQNDWYPSSLSIFNIDLKSFPQPFLQTVCCQPKYTFLSLSLFIPNSPLPHPTNSAIQDKTMQMGFSIKYELLNRYYVQGINIAQFSSSTVFCRALLFPVFVKRLISWGVLWKRKWETKLYHDNLHNSKQKWWFNWELL